MKGITKLLNTDTYPRCTAKLFYCPPVPTQLTGAPTDAPKQGSCWSRCHRKINRVWDDFFYRLGYWVATHPKLTLFTALLFVVACTFGFANFEAESDGKKLCSEMDVRQCLFVVQ